MKTKTHGSKSKSSGSSPTAIEDSIREEVRRAYTGDADEFEDDFTDALEDVREDHPEYFTGPMNPSNKASLVRAVMEEMD